MIATISLTRLLYLKHAVCYANNHVLACDWLQAGVKYLRLALRSMPSEFDEGLQNVQTTIIEKCDSRRQSLLQAHDKSVDFESEVFCKVLIRHKNFQEKAGYLVFLAVLGLLTRFPAFF